MTEIFAVNDESGVKVAIEHMNFKVAKVTRVAIAEDIQFRIFAVTIFHFLDDALKYDAGSFNIVNPCHL